jgi:hypothetical protein
MSNPAVVFVFAVAEWFLGSGESVELLCSSRVVPELCSSCVCVCDVTVGFLKWISSNLSGANFAADFLAHFSAL